MIGQPQDLDAPIALGLRKSQQRRRLDIDDDPFASRASASALACPHQLLGLRIRAYGDKNAIACKRVRAGSPWPRRRARCASTRSATRRSASSRSAKRLGLRKKRSTAFAASSRHVHLAGMQARQQIVRRQIDQLELVGLVENMVRKSFALAHAGDLRDQIVQTLQVLNIDRGPDADAGLNSSSTSCQRLG